MHGFVVGVVRGVLAVVACGVVLSGLHAAGQGVLAAPPLDVGAFAPWVRARAPLIVAVALLRVLALGIAWYLAGVTVLTVLSRLTGVHVLARLAWSLSTPAVRRLTHGAVGLSLVAAVAAPAAAGTAPSADAGWSPPTANPPEVDSGWRPPTLGDRGPQDPATQQHVVTQGESLWTIAVDVVERRTAGPVTDATIADYWRRLVEVNRDRLVRQGDPDLILPGQDLVLPDLGPHASDT